MRFRDIGDFLFRDPIGVTGFCLWGGLALCSLVPVLPEPVLSDLFNYYGDPLFLLLLIAGIWRGLRVIRHVEERWFWILLICGFGFWFAARLQYLFFEPSSTSSFYDILSDVLYVCFFLCVLLAISSTPHLPSGWSRRSNRYTTEAIAGGLLVMGLLTYFVLIPARLSEVVYIDWDSSFQMYLVLDCFLVLGFAYSLRNSVTYRWKLLYTLFLIGSVMGLIGDTVEILMRVEVIRENTPGEPIDLLWFAVYLPFLAAARVKDLSVSEPLPRESARDTRQVVEQKLDPLRRSTPVLYAFVLPMIHLILVQLGLQDEATQQARGITVFVVLLLIAGVAMVHNQALESDRRRAVLEYRELFEEAPVLYLVATRHEGVLFAKDCNAQFLTTLGYALDDVLDRPCSTFVAGGVLSEDIGRSPQLEPEPQDRLRECRLLRKDSSFLPALERTHEVRDRSGEVVGIRAAYVDISERKKLEDELRQLHTMEAVSQLAGGFAHEFNNLLTVVHGYAQIALTDLGSQPVAEDLRKVLAASDRGASLTGSLLAFASRQLIRPRVVDLNQVVVEGRGALEKALGSGVKLEYHLEGPVPHVKIDPSQVERVLLTLGENARDAMPAGGTLSITVSTEPVALETMGSGQSPRVLLSVSDTGEGIEEEILDRIFDPFFTTKEVGKGSGLGLAAVHGIVRQCGGEISVTSTPGEGTTFQIAFPAEEDLGIPS